MTTEMETNKWLWQPNPKGPIYLRLTYRDQNGKRKSYVHSLGTSHWPTARQIRDTEFTPIIMSIEKAATQLEVIHRLYPELEKQLRTGLHGGFAEKTTGKVVTLGELRERWYADISKPGSNRGTAPATARRYGGIAGMLVRDLGADRAVMTIDTTTVSDYRDRRLTEAGKSKRTLRLELVVLRNMFDFAVEKRMMLENPAKGVVVKSTKAQEQRENRDNRRRPPTRPEADQICTMPRWGHPVITDAECRDLALLARYTGMRQGEIFHTIAEDLMLFPADLHADKALSNRGRDGLPFAGQVPDGMVLCCYVADREGRQTKTGLERVVPVADKLMPVLTRLLAQHPKGPLFPAITEAAAVAIAKSWLHRVKKISRELTFHGFRHYATSEMENSGVSAGIACAILGHVEGSVHSKYYHKALGLMKAGVDKIY